MFQLYKEFGTKWTIISRHLPNHDENDAKNRFYTTLKRVATQAQLEDPIKYDKREPKCRKNLVQFVDLARKYSHLIPSKKGRKKDVEKARARTQGILFHDNQPLPPSTQPMTDMQLLGNSVWPANYCFLPPPVQYVIIPYLQSGTGLLQSGTTLFNLIPNHGKVNNYNAQYQTTNH